MQIQEIKDKNIWEEFFSTGEEKSFLQSWNWGEFQEKMGNKIWRFGAYDAERLIGIALVSKIIAKRGTFLLVQHGPYIPKGETKILKIFLDKFKEIAKEEKASFIRINPLWELCQDNINILKNLGFRKAPMHANAYEATWKLEITKSEEDIFKEMRKTTRYLLRQAQKNSDIIIEKSSNPEDIEIYKKLNREVAFRQKFVPFSAEYIKNEFECFSKDGNVLWLFGKYKGEVAAAALVVFWSGIGFYHQAASLYEFSRLSIPYLLQWEAIKEAKKRGCTLYDFWGYTDPKKYPKHPWAGPTLFKMGFGGFPIEYVKTQDYPISKKYWLTYIFENLRKIKRGF